ncbi:hypothetical protein PR202_gb11247 [Eleusine coracana subsp. coracana]|uniref:FAF domain-containing protein n=1 Tax=Eleusine coracana subsp. coracana TaxID=191504 RepID=A0AAV5EM27_ELECO|nr:hypothetical protein QOZ80_3BG0264780 [Eleusine coracana subsp. coracana]GJN23584.1 hypothetical protein PR202_gb11247 [Eleusine coracana subsp. coracana]
MSVAVCRGPLVVPPAFEAPRWLKPAPEPAVERLPPAPARVDIWNAIQADVDSAKKAAAAAAPKKEAATQYVHPLVRRSSSRLLLSQKSLEVCTESLGNETGSGDFTSSLDDLFHSSPLPAAAEEESSFWESNGCGGDEEEEDEEVCEEEEGKKAELHAVNYHCSSATARRRAFPPPLPSMSRRDGPCLQMRSRREAGRLVVEAVAVRPRGFLHSTRQGGRLRLAFVECSARDQSTQSETNKVTEEAPFFPVVDQPPYQNEQEKEEASMEMEEEEEEEEEVEVVDRGTVVEVKVSTQPQTPASGGKVHRSRLVINKFVGGTPLAADQQPRSPSHSADAAADEAASPPPSPAKLRRVPSSTTTLAAAVAEASTGSDDEDECGGVRMDASAVAEPKQLLLLTSRRGDKQDILQSVRRCRQLRQKPLFILEPYCIATT